MLDSKFFFTLVGLLVAVVAIYNADIPYNTNEGFLPPMIVKASRVGNNKSLTGVLQTSSYMKPSSYSRILSNDMDDEQFLSQQQKLQSFRGTPNAYTNSYVSEPVINYYSPGTHTRMGALKNPINFAEMAINNFGEEVVVKQVKCVTPYSDLNMSDIAVADMTTINQDGEAEKVIIYDRAIYANQRSKTRGLGCMLRGDLPITPCDHNGWFTPSLGISDLRQGAMEVMGGKTNETSNQLAEIQWASSLGTMPAASGVPVDAQMRSQYSASLDSALNGIKVTAFP
jgi:hypothetical protein